MLGRFTPSQKQNDELKFPSCAVDEEHRPPQSAINNLAHVVQPLTNSSPRNTNVYCKSPSEFGVQVAKEVTI